MNICYFECYKYYWSGIRGGKQKGENGIHKYVPICRIFLALSLKENWIVIHFLNKKHGSFILNVIVQA